MNRNFALICRSLAIVFLLMAGIPSTGLSGAAQAQSSNIVRQNPMRQVVDRLARQRGVSPAQIAREMLDDMPLASPNTRNTLQAIISSPSAQNPFPRSNQPVATRPDQYRPPYAPPAQNQPSAFPSGSNPYTGGRAPSSAVCFPKSGSFVNPQGGTTLWSCGCASAPADGRSWVEVDRNAHCFHSAIPTRAQRTSQ